MQLHGSLEQPLVRSRESSLSSLSSLSSVDGVKEAASDSGDECPSCIAGQGPKTWPRWKTMNQLQWVQCSSCDTWLHAICAGFANSAGLMKTILSFNCPRCIERYRHGMPAQSSMAPVTYKTVSHSKMVERKSARHATASHISYSNLDSGIAHDPEKWPKLLAAREFGPHKFRRMPASALNMEWALTDPEAFLEPIIIDADHQVARKCETEQESGSRKVQSREPKASDPDNPPKTWTEGVCENRSVYDLGMKMPHHSVTVGDIAEMVGEDTRVEVIDVASQQETGNWDMARWANYYMDPVRDTIRNVISLEVSDSRMMRYVERPEFVRQLDWVDQAWPKSRKANGEYPKVQMYCLMGVDKSYTDWHIDFAGSSVFYHILKGSKTFYFIRPTPENLAAYERWSSSESQEETWLGESVSEIQEVKLTSGMTMMIPSAWIHAVYTPDDALVFGGNFVHGLNIEQQLRVVDIEERAGVLARHRFPRFWELCWYIADRARKVLSCRHGVAAAAVKAERPLHDGKENIVSDPFDRVTLSPRGQDELRLLVLRLADQAAKAKSNTPAQITKHLPRLHREIRGSLSNGFSDLRAPQKQISAEERRLANQKIPKDTFHDPVDLIIELSILLGKALPERNLAEYFLQKVAGTFRAIVGPLSSDIADEPAQSLKIKSVKRKSWNAHSQRAIPTSPFAPKSPSRHSVSQSSVSLQGRDEAIRGHLAASLQLLTDLPHKQNALQSASNSKMSPTRTVETKDYQQVEDGVRYRVMETKITIVERHPID